MTQGELPPNVIPHRLLPGNAKLHVELGVGSRSSVVLPGGMQRPDIFMLKFFWSTEDGKTTPVLALNIVAETSPMEMAAWLTRISANLLSAIMDVPPEEQPKPAGLRLVADEEGAT